MGPQTAVIFVAFHMLLLLKLSVQRSDNKSLIYKAAVVEYSAPLGITLDTKEAHYRHNAETFAQITKRAAELECDIIVFPEYGLLSMDLPKLEDGSPSLAVRIPTPKEKINPCVDDKDGLYKDLKELSCAAKDNGIYLVVNVVEFDPCSSNGSDCATKNRPCPKNKAFYYNSNVVFDREGSVVARYRMYHLYGEMPLVPPDNPEYTVIETDFGINFGMFISFDMSFQQPALNLVTELGVRDILYTTCWFSEMPFQTAVQYQAAWSHAMDVNFLSAGYNYPEYGSGGSGIYAGKMGTLAAVMPKVRSSYLLVATVVKKHAPCYDEFFKILPNGLVVPLPGETGEKEPPPYEYDRNNPVTEPAVPVKSPSKVAEEPSSPEEVKKDDRDGAVEEEPKEETVELGIPEESTGEEPEQEKAPGGKEETVELGTPEESTGEEPEQEKAPGGKEETVELGTPEESTGEDTEQEKAPGGKEETVELGTPEESTGEDTEQEKAPGGNAGDEKLCPCCKKPYSDGALEKPRGPAEEQDHPEPPAKVGRKTKCGAKSSNGESEENAPDESGEPPEEQDYSEPPAKVGRKTKCGAKSSNGESEVNAPDESGEPSEEQDYSEPPAKVGGKAKCGMKYSNGKPQGNAAYVSEEQEQKDYSEPPAKAGRKAKCGMKNSNAKPEGNAADVSEEQEEHDYSEPPTKAGRKAKCGMKNSNGKPEGNAAYVSEEQEEKDYSEPPAKAARGMKNSNGKPQGNAADVSEEQEEKDYSEPPAKAARKGKCGMKNSNGKPEGNAAYVSEEQEEKDYSEPPAKAARGMKNSNGEHEGNAADESGEPPEEQESPEPPAKVCGKKKCECGMKNSDGQPDKKAPDESGELPEEQKSPEKSGEPPEEEEPLAEVGGDEMCDVKSSKVEPEGSAAEESEDREPEPPEDVGEEVTCGGRKLSLDSKLEDFSEEGGGHEDEEIKHHRQLKGDDFGRCQRRFTDAQSQTEEEHESMDSSVLSKDEVKEYPEEVGGGTEEREAQGMIDEGEYKENVAQRESSEEKVVTNLPHPCIEEALFTRYAKKWQPSYALPQNKPGSGLHVKGENLESYITFRLTSDKMKENSSVRLCHGTFCCDFNVVMCSGGECSGDMCSSCDGPHYNYRLVAFDGLRNMDQFGEGRYQVCAVISCADDNLQSCGQFIKDPNVNVNYTRFYHLLISGVFKRMNTIVGANTVAYNLLPLPVSKFEFFSEEIADDEQGVKMESIAPELTFLTFGIYGRNYDVDDYRINKLVCEA